MFLRHRFLLLAALAGCAAFAQSQATSVVGTVESVSGDVVYVNTGVGLLALSTDARTEVWKGQVFHDLSPVAAGDSVAARYRMDAASGKLVADALWLNITNLSAVITKVTGDRFEVRTKLEDKIIEVDADTRFEASAQEDLRPGRNVQVVGLVLGNGEILATKVTVYDGNTPVRMRGDAVIRRADGSLR